MQGQQDDDLRETWPKPDTSARKLQYSLITAERVQTRGWPRARSRRTTALRRARHYLAVAREFSLRDPPAWPVRVSLVTNPKGSLGKSLLGDGTLLRGVGQ
jgi:hypothetical protein